jgi:hypothetical protein
MTEVKHARAMQEFKVPNACKEVSPPKDHTSLLQISPPLASNTKRSSHPEAVVEEDSVGGIRNQAFRILKIKECL